MQYDNAVKRAIVANANAQFAFIIFCAVHQVSDIVKHFSGEKRRVPQVQKVETLVFCKRGMSIAFRDSRLVDSEHAVRVQCMFVH